MEAVASRYETESGAEKSCMIAPRTFKASDPKRGCIYCWGHGNQAGMVSHPLYWNGIGRAPAVYNRTPVVSGNYGGQLWGNDTALGWVDALWTYYQARGLTSDKVSLIGVSMGALLALNWAKANPTKVSAVVGVNPVVDVQDIHANNRGGYAAEIASVYGGGAPDDAHNPADNAASYTGIPIKLWYSTDDAVVMASTVTNFSSAAGAAVSSLGAVGHTAGSLDPADVAAFLAANP